MTYLDNSATSFPKAPGVGGTICDFLENEHGNPGRGTYGISIKSSDLLMDVRKKAAALFGITDPMRIALVPSSTYGLNTAIYTCIRSSTRPAFVISPMEHNAVTRPLEMWQKEVDFPVIVSGGPGFLMDPNTLYQNIAKLKKQGRNVTIIVTLSSNITGHINNISVISQVAGSTNSKLILDSSQGAGSVPISVSSLPRLDYMAVPGHKGLLGPQGTGLLYVSKDSPIYPLVLGGTGTGSFSKESLEMPNILECGTLNTPGFVGLGHALEYIKNETPEKLLYHKQNMCKIVSDMLYNCGRIIPVTNTMYKNSGIFSFNIQGLHSQEVVRILDKKYGIAVRGGMHCSPLGHKHLGTLATGAVRISPGPFTTEKEMQYAGDCILHMLQN